MMTIFQCTNLQIQYSLNPENQLQYMQFGNINSSHSCCKSSIISGCSQTAGYRKETVISGRYLVSKFIDFSYTVPLQRRTNGITRLSPYVPPYLRILPLNALHIFASIANVTSRTQVAF
ncbi:Hypothetical_protein [Hexamita inflata]|uniref:Hypothetical_protein n=1 Tax=Hexamita inflata TaxID=28002 RepID=A0AA86U6V7_9EUKA|nr:Hypothetical protein HINF_LOCUS27722 [Hexamita inflata]